MRLFPAMSPAWILHLLVLVATVAFFIPSQLQGGETWDETLHKLGYESVVAFGEQALDGDAPDFEDIAMDLEYYGLLPMVLPATVDAYVEANTEMSGEERADLYRLLLHVSAFLYAVGSVYLTWSLINRLSGRRWFALAGAGLLLFCPLWLGHSFFNYKDIATAFVFTLALYGAVITAGKSGRAYASGLSIFGLGAVGIAGIKTAALAFLLVPALFLLAGALTYRGQRLTRSIALVFAGGLAVGLVYLITPPAWLQPLTFLTASIDYMSSHQWGGCTLTAGTCIGYTHGDWSATDYLASWATVSLPVLLQVGLPIAGVLILIRGSWPGRMLLLAGLTPVALMMVRNASLYDGLRHLVFLLPLCFALLAYGAALAIPASARRLQHVAAACASLLLVVSIADNARMLPYNYAYFNAYARFTASETSFETDYWGYGLGEAARRLDRHIARHGREAGLYHANPGHLVPPFLKTELGWQGPDALKGSEPVYYLTYTRANTQLPQNCELIGSVERTPLFAGHPIRFAVIGLCNRR